MNDSACSLEQSRFLSIQFLYCLAKTSVLLVLNPHFACANLQFGWFNPQVLMASPSAPSLRGGNEVDGPVGAGQMVNRTMEVQWFRTCLGLKIGYQYVPVPWVPHSIHWSILIPCCFPAIKRGNGKSAPTARNWGASWLRPMHSQRRPELSRKIGLTKNEGDETSAIAGKECEMCIASSCICIEAF